MSLHDDIMNLRCEVPKDANANQALSFKCGHKQARHAAAELANTVDAELERLRARVAELEARPIPEISSVTPKLAGWIMTADDDCGADWFEFAGDHEKPPDADKFFRPVPVFFGASEGVCLGDPVVALEQIGRLIGAESQAALAQSEHLKNLAP